MVRQLAVNISRELGLDAQTETLVDVAVRVRDVGMLALPDSVVLATTPFSPVDWELIHRHPVIGAQLLERLGVVAPAAQVVRSHHERLDGRGYPDGCGGDAIPLLSRVIATCDAFVAMAGDRPHRRGLGAEVALEHVSQLRGSQFDPRIVDALVAALAGKRRRRNTARGANGDENVAGDRASGQTGLHDLTSAIAEFDVVPAFALAHDRVLALTATDGIIRGELVEAIEGDTGLTIAVLRRAQSVVVRRPIANVADAVAALSTIEIADAIETLPRAGFPWRTSPLEVFMQRARVHARAVARAAERISRDMELVQRDDVAVVALLHDIGKLVLGRAVPGYASATERTSTPGERTRHERRSWGMDHASLGGLLLRRWGLPQRLASAVAAHHSSEADHEAATYVSLADLIVHQIQGDRIDRNKMLRLADRCGLSANTLRDVLFDLPHAGGSHRRRAELSPLTSRETAVLHVLAQGKVYKAIALELGVSASTVRSHLHNTYAKLGVDNRAQAVLRATEMGWI